MLLPDSSALDASPTRRYSDKQLRAMQAIGLIPWIRRESRAVTVLDGEPIAAAASVSTRASTPAQAPAPAQASTPAQAPRPESTSVASAQPDFRPVAAAAPTSTSPATPALFEGWQLQAFCHGAREMIVMGPEAASLLVLLEPMSEPALPLADADQKLLRAMLQAIELRLSDVRLAGLSRKADAQLPKSEDGAAELSSVLIDSLRAIVILTARPEPDFSKPLSCALARRSLPVWYCPHPAVLRQVPEQKRDAWQVLKAIRRQLGPR